MLYKIRDNASGITYLYIVKVDRDKVTFVFDLDAVVRSAPLHDVGKINIPDNVLNKPGKLTDEEYEIMKTHTTAGMKIMEKAIDTVGGENYLKEARNMAAYHHERWDGKGTQFDEKCVYRNCRRIMLCR